MKRRTLLKGAVSALVCACLPLPAAGAATHPLDALEIRWFSLAASQLCPAEYFGASMTVDGKQYGALFSCGPGTMTAQQKERMVRDRLIEVLEYLKGRERLA